MKVSTIDIEAGDLNGGRLTDEARQKLKESLEHDLGSVPKELRESVLRGLTGPGGIDDLIGDGNLSVVGAKLILKSIERVIDMLDGLPEGMRLLAKTGARNSGRAAFELGEVSQGLIIAAGCLQVAKAGLEHFIECNCSPVKAKGDTAPSAPPSTPEAPAS
jgi:hypothetical protein